MRIRQKLNHLKIIWNNVYEFQMLTRSRFVKLTHLVVLDSSIHEQIIGQFTLKCTQFFEVKMGITLLIFVNTHKKDYSHIYMMKLQG